MTAAVEEDECRKAERVSKREWKSSLPPLEGRRLVLCVESIVRV